MMSNRLKCVMQLLRGDLAHPSQASSERQYERLEALVSTSSLSRCMTRIGHLPFGCRARWRKTSWARSR